MPPGRTEKALSDRGVVARRVLRPLPLLAVLLLTLSLAGCLDGRTPRLALAPADELVMSAARSTVVVRNTGGQVLNWRVYSDDPRVRVDPRDGSIFASGSMTVTIEIDELTLDKHQVLAASLMFRSNGGDAETLVIYSPESGIGRCGGYLPYELPLLDGLLPLRTALPGVGAVPVGNEILVAYRAPPAPAGPIPYHMPGGAKVPDAGHVDTPLSAAQTSALRAQLQADHGLALVA